MNIHEFNPFVRFMDKRRGGTPYSDFVLAYDHRLFYVTLGGIRVLYEGNDVLLREGQAVIIPPGTKYKLEYLFNSEYYVLNFDFTYNNELIGRNPIVPDVEAAFDSKRIISSETCGFFPAVLSSESDASEFFSHIHELYSKKDYLYNELISAGLKKFVTEALAFTRYDKTPDDMKKILSFLNRHYLDSLTNSDIAKEFSFHPNYINRIFKEHTGKTLHAYIIDQRLNKACKLLLSTELSVASVSEMCSFDSYAYFIKCFKRRFSLPPAQYRRANKAML